MWGRITKVVIQIQLQIVIEKHSISDVNTLCYVCSTNRFPFSFWKQKCSIIQ